MIRSYIDVQRLAAKVMEEGFKVKITLHVSPEEIHALNREAREMCRYTNLPATEPHPFNSPVFVATAMGEVAVYEDREKVMARIAGLEKTLQAERARLAPTE